MKIFRMNASKFWYLFFYNGGRSGIFAGLAFTATVIAAFYVWLYIVPLF